MSYQHPPGGYETRDSYSQQQWPPVDQPPPWRGPASDGDAHAARHADAAPAARWHEEPPESRPGAWAPATQQPWAQPTQPQAPPSEQHGGWTPPQRDPLPEAAAPSQAAVWVTLRNQAATTVRAVNATHCHEAFQRYGTREALSPHGVVFLYATMGSRPGASRVYQATRLALSDPAFDDAERFLSGLTVTAQREIQQSQRSRQPWDLRGPQRSMVNAGDMDMPPEAVFIGCALETLDTELGSWFNMARSIKNQSFTAVRPMTVFDLPGRAYVALTDGSFMDVRRDHNLRLGETGVRIGKRLDPEQRSQSWRDDDLTQLAGQPQALWAGLTGLHDTLADYLIGPRS